jgi:hypothetical protein
MANRTERFALPANSLACALRVEEGLVQQDSPFCGTKKFGMCYVDKEGRVASIGTILEIVEFAHIKVLLRGLLTASCLAGFATMW